MNFSDDAEGEKNSHKKQDRHQINWSIAVSKALFFESLIIVIIGIYLSIAPLFSHTTHPVALFVEVIFSALGALGLFISARAFRNNSLLGKGPALLANGIAVGVSYFMDKAHFWIAGIPLGLLGAFVIYLIIMASKESTVKP